MTPEFSALVDPVFQSVLDFIRRIERGENFDLQFERSRIRNAIDDAERMASTPSSPVTLQEFQVAKQALVYWADEVLTEAAPDWKDILLEREYFGSRTRAWKFYVEGELNGMNSSPDVAETFYLAIVLGFVGDIRDAFRNHLNRDLPGASSDPDEAREAWAKQLYERIRVSEQPELSGEPLEGHIAPLNGQALFRVAAIVFGVVCVLCLLGWLWFALMKKGEEQVSMNEQPVEVLVG